LAKTTAIWTEKSHYSKSNVAYEESRTSIIFIICKITITEDRISFGITSIIAQVRDSPEYSIISWE